MTVRTHYPVHPQDFERLTPEQLRARFVVTELFAPGEARFALNQGDRLLIGGAVPADEPIALHAPEEIRSKTLLERREVAIVCLSGPGAVDAGGVRYEMASEDILYLGRGVDPVAVSGSGAVFYFVSATAHQSLPAVLTKRADADSLVIGDANQASQRTLRKYIHDQGVSSCQLAVGITTLEPGNVWNTMPCHTHERRTEIYLYFDLPEDERIVHLCGRPEATRSLVLADREAVISPPWSIHTGAGTHPYRFVWSTGGENLAYNDMDAVETHRLR